MFWGMRTPALSILRPRPATCTAPHAPERRGSPQPSALRGRDGQAPPRSPAARPLAQPRRNSSCRESARTAVLAPGPARASRGYARRHQARTVCAGVGRVCSQDNRNAVTVAHQPHYLHKSTERSRSRIWIVSESVSTSLQPSQSIQIYSTQT